jgi:uncharacterized protein YukE
MYAPDPEPGYIVSTHMLNSAASSLEDQATGIASLRDAFNSACYGAESAFRNGFAQHGFNEFFTTWFAALDAQAETLGSVADATQQCAVIYDHAERTVLADIPAMARPSRHRQPAHPRLLRHPFRSCSARVLRRRPDMATAEAFRRSIPVRWTVPHPASS